MMQVVVKKCVFRFSGTLIGGKIKLFIFINEMFF